MTNPRKVPENKKEEYMDHAHPTSDWTITPYITNTIQLLTTCCDAIFNLDNFRKK